MTPLRLREWLHALELPVPPRDVSTPVGDLSISGGTCTGLSIGSLNVVDLTQDSQVPVLGYRVGGTSLRCHIIAMNGTLTVNFRLVDVAAELNVATQPFVFDSFPPLPLGKLTVDHCALSANLEDLSFGGSSQNAEMLEGLKQVLEAAVDYEVPLVACSQVKPEVEKRGTEALGVLARRLEPLMAKPVPPAMPAGMGAPLVDWGMYPPLQLLRQLVAHRGPQVTDVIRDAIPVQVPLDLDINVFVNGTRVQTHVSSVSLDGISSLAVSRLALQGNGSLLDVAAQLGRVAVKAETVLQVALPRQRNPLMQPVSASFSLTQPSVALQAYAMLSDPELNSLKVDQLQESSCLAASAQSAGVAAPRAPLGLRALEFTGASPVFTLFSEEPLEAAIGKAAGTTLAAISHGYMPGIEAVVRGGVAIVQPQLDAGVLQYLGQSTPCPPTRVFYGPGDTINALFLWGSVFLAVLGLAIGCGCSHAGCSMRGRSAERSELMQLEDSDDDDEEIERPSLWKHSAVPTWVALSYPFGVVMTMGLFVYADMGLGTVVNLVFRAGSESTIIGPAFSFSLLSCVRDSWKAGAYCIAILTAGVSGIWPFIKLTMLLCCWIASAECLREHRRECVLRFLDEYGKYSLIDSWLAVIALCSYNITWAGAGASIAIVAVPLVVFFFFVIATVLSLVCGHIATFFHDRAAELDAQRLQVSKSFTDTTPRPLGKSVRNAGVLAVALVVTTIGVLVTAMVMSFQVVVGGAAAIVLMDPPQWFTDFSLLSLTARLTNGGPESPAPLGMATVQAIFFVFAFLIPLVLCPVLLLLLLAPLQRPQQIQLMRLCRVLDAWAAFDVFAAAVFVASLEFALIAKLLIYHDNIEVLCGFVKSHLRTECMTIEVRLTWGFLPFAIAALASYAVPKVVLRRCQEVAEDADSPYTQARKAVDVDSGSESDTESPRCDKLWSKLNGS